MYSSIEVFAIIMIIVIQLIIAFRAYNQINQMNSFLPDGRSSLTLKEYEIPSEKILDLEPSQVINRITYIVKRKEEISKDTAIEPEKENVDNEPDEIELLASISHYDEEEV